MEPTPSTLGNGKYTVCGVLGEGAQGKTYDAVDANGRPVAIKRFDVRGAKSWKDVELAEREARVLAGLDHPLVPRYIEHFEDDGALYLVMEKIQGETLDQLRKKQGTIHEDEVRRFLADADRALTYLHGRSSPIVHRDIKPRNVVRRPNGSYVIVDFGAVSELLHRREGASTVVGTLGFMAPEQLQGRALATTDIYAVGATALAMLTGADPDQLPHQGLKVDVRAAVGARVSPPMVHALEAMLEPDPDRRAQSVGAALEPMRTSQRPPQPSAPPLQPAFHYRPLPGDPAELAMVKSARRLLWALAPIVIGIFVVAIASLNVSGTEPLIPVGVLAILGAVLVLNWHNGTLLAALMRKAGLLQPLPQGQRVSLPEQVHHRIDVGPSAQVRVHTTEVRPDELGQTERTSTRQAAAAQARRL